MRDGESNTLLEEMFSFNIHHPGDRHGAPKTIKHYILD